VRFRLSFVAHRDMRGVAVFVGIRSGISRELLTSARHVVTEAPVAAGTVGTVLVDLPSLNLRPGEYPLYLHVSEATESPTNYDVLDDLTPPLVMTAGRTSVGENFDPSRPMGAYSIPSRLVVEGLGAPGASREGHPLALTNR
jgi:hypothetical protein